jgi:hypothetical protein
MNLYPNLPYLLTDFCEIRYKRSALREALLLLRSLVKLHLHMYRETCDIEKVKTALVKSVPSRRTRFALLFFLHIS